MREFDLGAVTAYAIAVKHGFKGTEAEWAEYMQANAVVAKEAETNAKQYAENAKASETNVGKSATDAKAAATNAATSAQNAAKSAQRAEEAANKAGGIKSVNGKTPDANGNVEIDSVASWNDLTDKPFYEESTVVEILPECQPTYDAAEGGFFIENAPALESGKTYTVNWNRTEYTATAFDSSESLGVASVMLADDSFDFDTGEGVFLIVYEVDTAMLMCVDMSGSTELTVSIKTEQTTLVPLPTKYLPDGVPYCIDGGMVEVLAECQLTYGEDEDAFFLVDPIDIIEGKTYSVQWNGVEYTCVAQAFDTDGIPTSVLGNLGFFDESLQNTGEPFVMAVVPAEMVAEMGVGAIIYSSDGSTSLTLAIYGGGVEIRKLDNRCLDLEWLPTMGLSTLFEESEIAHGDFTYDLTYINFPPGTELVVVMDGAPYKVTVKQAGSGLDAVWYFGNGKLASTGLEGTADPFCASLYSTGATWRFADGGTHTIEICEEVPNKMPIEFLPDLAWLPVFEGETVLDCTAVVSVADSPATIPALSTTLERETEVDVYINGVHYDGVRSHDSDGEYISAVGSVSGVVGFDIKRFDDKYLIGVGSSSAFFLSSVAGTYTVKVTLKATPNKMPEEFLPESVDGVIIRSSTEGSTKKFKLTVDDSGTITATEVTA